MEETISSQEKVPKSRHKCTWVGRELLEERRRWFRERPQQTIKTAVLLKEARGKQHPWYGRGDHVYKPRNSDRFNNPEVQASLAANKHLPHDRLRWDKAADRNASFPASSASALQSDWLEESGCSSARTVCGWRAPLAPGEEVEEVPDLVEILMELRERGKLT